MFKKVDTAVYELLDWTAIAFFACGAIVFTVIAIVKVTNIVIGFIRRKKLVALHTVLNKTTGLLLFFLPLTLQFVVPTYSLAVICPIATIAAIQEGYYTINANDK
mgnify:CR=1 FL=1